jgi:hypothetical protein
MGNTLRFFTHDRLDLVVKYRFFEALKHGTSEAQVEEMYARHILARTGGIEPGSRTKTSLPKYVEAARELFQSMTQNGYDPAWPIPVDQWGRLRDGAHRLACATVLNLEVELVAVHRQYPIRQWGLDWFLTKGFGRQYVNGLLDDVNRITGYPNSANPKAERQLVRLGRLPERNHSRGCCLLHP